MTALLALALFAQAQEPNRLAATEKEAGWRLLFDGTLGPLTPWRAFRGAEMPPGWAVKEGALVSVKPATGNDIVTKQQFEWFELMLEFKIEPGQNSGIMFHVTEDGEATWHSGPEIQIYDAKPQPGVETTGYLYQLYKPDFDAAKPAGEWQQLHIRIAPDVCWTKLNGRRLYEFVLDSDDFRARVAKSKFAKYSGFGAHGRGHLAIQGDHGVVWFRNIKVRDLND
ncbi:MAG: DUF1080 domain-containing protein [Fimbriimonadaceae bacterium]|nr:DUF1080 domain-containing protein [Fimbriimonadaceae bacterium]QYK58480.1 MAG: DUF1080 domain-containing protein [Fimbriimonadaceae bacterium]